MRTIQFGSRLLSVAGMLLLVASVHAGPVTWDIDASQSYLRLNVPDQVIQVAQLGTATVRVRDAVGSAWTDAGGRRAFFDGTISTNYVDGSSIEFLSGQHNVQALETTLLRPNPSAFNPANTNTANPNGQYGNSSTATAAFGARLPAVTLILPFDVAFFSFRDVFLDLASAPVALGGGTIIGANSTSLGFASLDYYLDGVSVVGNQFLPDVFNQQISGTNSTNASAGSVTIVDSVTRRLNLTVNVPMAIDLGGGAILNASATGQIVAVATIPEPSTIVMLGIGTAALGLTAIRRCRVRK